MPHTAPPAVRSAADWQSMANALQRAAMAVARRGGPLLFDDLLAELAAGLGVPLVLLAELGDAGKTLRSLAARLQEQPVPRFVAPLPPAIGACVANSGFLSGEAPELARSAGADGLPSFAAWPLQDGASRSLGVLVAMSREPLRDAQLAESMLRIFGTRMAAELELRRVDDALRRSEASYRAIFEAAEESIVIHDWETGATIDANPKACESCGYTREELIGQPPEGLGSGLGGSTDADALRYLDMARRGESPLFEWQRRNKDGSLHWGEVRLKAAMIDGKPHILAFRRDITERKLAHEALQLREEQYRVIFEAASDGFVLRDGRLRTLDANPAFYRMYGFERAHIAAGGGYPAHFPDDYIAQRDQQIERALQGHETHVETIALRADGSAFWVDLRVIPVRYRGEPHVLQVVRDISALREREQALQRSEARLRATVDAALDSIIGMDAQGRIVEFNGAAERCFGQRRADVLGRPLAAVIIPPRHREAHAHGLQRFLRDGAGPFVGRLVETTAVRADGSEFPVELAISVGETADSRIFVGHVRDITARREAQAQRAELEAQLRQAQKMEAIGQLTGGIAHDFNNILTSVLGYIVLAGERAQAHDDARLIHQLAQAELAAQRARDLIAQMLTFARRGRSERKTLALAPVVRQALELLRSTLPSGIELSTDFAAGVPAVSADALQLEQVLFNLCINARDAMNGTGALRVTLQERTVDAPCASCRQPASGRWVDLGVADQGGGIPPEVRERMFDPFFTTKEVGRGTGMGLAMVHGIVHGHGGHIVVETAPGGGTVFRVLLPVAATGAEPPPAPRAGAAVRPEPLRGRLLLVEDEAMVGAFMSELLGGWGLDVAWCQDPLEACLRFETEPERFDVVITDQAMPRMSGLDLARAMLAVRPALPVLLYTGFGEALDELDATRLGLRAVLRKPVDRDLLLAALRDCLS